jgi:hypothetical protein
MKFKKLNSEKEININISKYLIKDWKNLKKVSNPEKKVLNFLYPYWKSHVVLKEFLIPGSLLRIDILNLTLKTAIEVSPEATHTKFNKFMHGSRIGYLNTIKRDDDKMNWIENNGFKYICLEDEDLENLSEKLFLEKYEVTL